MVATLVTCTKFIDYVFDYQHMDEPSKKRPKTEATLPEEQSSTTASPLIHKEDIISEKAPSQNAVETKILGFLESDLECGICKNVVIQCHGVSCGHIFCWYCITRWSYDYETCPICRLYMDYIAPILPVDNLLNSLYTAFQPDLLSSRRESQEERVKDIKRREDEWNRTHKAHEEENNSYFDEDTNEIPVVVNVPDSMQWSTNRDWYMQETANTNSAIVHDEATSENSAVN